MNTPIVGRRLFLELLKQEGVKVMFGNPGTTELPLMDALAGEDEIHYVLALQESLVMAMADGYARASGSIAVANVHVAPGLGNAMGMLFDAHKAGSPVLVTAGQQAQGFGITEPNLYAELPSLARPFVKYAAEVAGVGDLPRLLHRAVKTALAPPSGPVFLSLPVDVMNAEADVAMGAPTRVAPFIGADPDEITRAARLLAAAERPVIIAGDAVAQSNAAAELIAFADALGAPVYLEGEPTTLPFPPAHRPDHAVGQLDQAHARSARPAGFDWCRPVHAVATAHGGAATAGDEGCTSRHRPVAAWQEFSN